MATNQSSNKENGTSKTGTKKTTTRTSTGTTRSASGNKTAAGTKSSGTAKTGTAAKAAPAKASGTTRAAPSAGRKTSSTARTSIGGRTVATGKTAGAAKTAATGRSSAARASSAGKTESEKSVQRTAPKSVSAESTSQAKKVSAVSSATLAGTAAGASSSSTPDLFSNTPYTSPSVSASGSSSAAKSSVGKSAFSDDVADYLGSSTRASSDYSSGKTSSEAPATKTESSSYSPSYTSAIHDMDESSPQDENPSGGNSYGNDDDDKKEKKSKALPIILISSGVVLMAGIGTSIAVNSNGRAKTGEPAPGAEEYSETGSALSRENTLSLASLYIDNGDYDQAVLILSSYLSENPADEDARELLEKAQLLNLSKNGNGELSDDILSNFDAKIKNGDYDGAAEYIRNLPEESLSSQGVDGNNLIGKAEALSDGRDLLNKGEYEKAGNVLDSYLSTNPRDPDVESMLASVRRLEALANKGLNGAETGNVKDDLSAPETAVSSARASEGGDLASLITPDNSQNRNVYTVPGTASNNSSNVSSNNNTPNNASGSSSSSGREPSVTVLNQNGNQNQGSGSSPANASSGTGAVASNNGRTPSTGSSSTPAPSSPTGRFTGIDSMERTSPSSSSGTKTASTGSTPSSSGNGTTTTSPSGTKTASTGTSPSSSGSSATTASPSGTKTASTGSTPSSSGNGTTTTSPSGTETATTGTSPSSSGSGTTTASPSGTKTVSTGSTTTSPSGTKTASTGSTPSSSGTSQASSLNPSARSNSDIGGRGSLSGLLSTASSSGQSNAAVGNDGTKTSPEVLLKKYGTRAITRKEALEVGNNFIDDGKYDECINLMNELLTLNPKDSEAKKLLDEARTLKQKNGGNGGARTTDQNLALAEKWINGGNYDDAITLLNSILSKDPDNERAKALLEKAQELKNNKNPEKDALKRAEKLSEAMRLINEGKYDEAQAILNQLLSDNPNDTQARNLLEQAEKKKERQNAENNDRLAKAKDALKDSDYKTAIDLLNEILKNDPDNEEAKKLLAQAKALEAQNQKDKQAAMDKAKKDLAEGNPEDAIKALEKYLAEHPDDKEAQKLLDEAKKAQAQKDKERADKIAEAKRLMEKGEYDKAAEILKALSKDNPDDKEISDLLKKANEASAAEIKDTKEKLSQAKKDIDGGDYEKAIAALNQILKDDPNNAEAKKLLKEAEEKKNAAKVDQAKKDINSGNYDKAISALEALLKEDPDNAEAKKLLEEAKAKKAAAEKEAAAKAKVDQAKKDINSGNYDKAISALEALLKEDPNNAEAKKLLEEAKAKKAAAEEEKAKAKDRTDNLAKARSLINNGDYDEAIKILNDLLKDNPNDTQAKNLLTQAQTKKAAAERDRANKLA
ncbi:MAG: tetratricopeptide repeat protein, partial [Treponema sp.]|nr:tetratricopeptide repeat protein [Treponema sp.]